MLPANVDPHDYQAKPQDIQRLADADVLVENGLGLESFLEDLVANAENDDLLVIDSSQDLPVLEMPESDGHKEAGHGEDAHAHGDAEHDEEGHEDHREEGHEDHEDEAHDEEGHDEEAHSEHAHDHSEGDPHVWLDPKKAIGQVENIRDGLIAADPEGEAVYTANAAAFIDELRSLDQSITETLAPYAGQTFVTFHDFAGHFADSYDLEMVYLVELPEGNAAPADMQRVIDVAKESELKTLLSEPQQSEGAFDAIAADLGIQVSVFDPIETTDEATSEPGDYIESMEQNLANLTTAFGAATP